MSAAGQARLWIAQRVTAIFLAVFVAIHLFTIVYAVRAGLGGAEVLARTRGSVGVAIFYGAFVVAASLHGAIGLRTVGMEWLRLSETRAGMLALAAGVALCALGMRAVFAVVAA